MAITPADCGPSGVEVESLLLCDIVGGVSVGTALAVYEYDSSGVPTGAPTFVIPGTNTPYVVQGSLQPCPNNSAAGDDTELVVLCDNGVSPAQPFIHKMVFDASGTLIGQADLDFAGNPYTVVGLVDDCALAPAVVFAGFVCDVFGGSDAQPAQPPTSPGTPLAAAAPDIVGSGYTEGPAGTFIQTSNVGTSLTFDRSPNDDQHAISAIHFELNPANGGNGFAAYGFQGVDVNGIGFSSDPGFIAAIEAAIGVGSDTPMPSGASASAAAGGTLVTFTNTGPSNNLMTSSGTGNFLTREGDGDGQASGVTLEFDPPVRVIGITSNTTADGATGLDNLQRSDATPGTAAVPAAPPSNTTVKQFRNADGSASYENLDGSAHGVVGTIQDCGERFQERLCDSAGNLFVRVYSIVGGAVTGFADYDLNGALFAPVGTVQNCAEQLATYRHTPIELLCWTDNTTGAVTTFLRRYLIDQDGVSVVAAVDSLLDGTTPFVASTSGTVDRCTNSGSDTDCQQVVLGSICYTPPKSVAVPAHTLTDDWAGVTVVGANGGPQTFTNNDFGGTGLGRVVVASLNKGAGLTGSDILLGIAPTAANSIYHEHLDFGGPVTGLSITFHSLGTLGNEGLLNITPAFTSIAGSGTATGGNTGVSPTSSNGTVTLTWAGPLSVLDLDWVSHAGGTLSTLSTVTFTTVATPGSDQTVGTAAMVRDCQTGAVSYIDLATNTALDLSTVTIVDCETGVTTAATSTVARQQGAGVQNVAVGAKALSVVVVSGTMTVTIGATAPVTLPAGASLSWADDSGLADAFVLTGVAGSDFLVTTTRG